MRALGAEIDYRDGYYFARAPGRLRGGLVEFPFVTVMGTENAILAAVLADGHTTIRPAAAEPEIDDLIAFLQKMGAEVERTGPGTIEVEGRKRLRGAEHRVVPDRIEAGTFAVAAAVTGGRVTVANAPCEHLGAFIDVLGRVGVGVSCTADTIEVDGTGIGAYRALDVETAPYPGLATDLQPPTCILLTQAARRQPRPRGDLRGPPRVPLRGPSDGRPGGADRSPPRNDPGRLAAARRRGGDRRPAGRREPHPGRPGRRREHDDPRCAPRSPGV